MEIHLHLSRQWRALDYKWGTPVDLDTSEADVTACPAIELDYPADTFSSEDYLRAIKRTRPTPYSRGKEDGRKGNVKLQSSKSQRPGPVTKNSELQDSAVSLAESEKSREDGLLEAMRGLTQDLETPLEESYMFNDKCLGKSSETLAGPEERRKEFESVFKQLKKAALSYVRKKYARKS